MFLYTTYKIVYKVLNKTFPCEKIQNISILNYINLHVSICNCFEYEPAILIDTLLF